MVIVITFTKGKKRKNTVISCCVLIGVRLATPKMSKRIDEKGYVASATNAEFALEVGKEVVAVDPEYFRPTEVDLLIGDPTKANTQLNWTPKYDLQHLVEDMMKGDLAIFKKDQLLKENGYKTLDYFE
mgnify:CR=1 FL=1